MEKDNNNMEEMVQVNLDELKKDSQKKRGIINAARKLG